MKLPRVELNKIKYTALAFLLPFCGLLILRMFCTLFFDGVYSMLYSDQYHQYYPFFVEFRRVLRSGDSLLYNWSVGMGMDYLGLVSYYLASPLNLLSAILPESLMLTYFSLLMPIKLGLAGLFFAIFLKRTFHKNDFSIALFGAFYALCAWALGYQWNIMWLDTFALLPLVVLGTVSLLRDKKFVLYTLTLFLSVFSNYYVGFFVCIFVFLIFICYQICRWKSISRFFADLSRIALFSLLAIGMTAILSLPALYALQSTQSGINTFPTEFKLNIAATHDWKGLLDAMRQVAGNMNGGLTPTFKEGLPNLYCGVFTNLLFFLFLTSKRIKLRDKICCSLLLIFFNLSFVIRQLDYIWHGFHFTNMIPYRFSFLYSFLMLYMAYRAWLHRRSFRLWQILTAGACSIVLLLFCQKFPDLLDLFSGKVKLYSWSSYAIDNIQLILDHCGFLFFTALFLIAYFIILVYGYRWRKLPNMHSRQQKWGYLRRLQARRTLATRLMFAFMAAELACNLLLFGVFFPATDLKDYPRGTKDTAAALQYMKEVEQSTLFYRAETAHSQTLNDGALNGYNGVSTFTSSANVNVTRFMKALGYGAKDTYNRYCFEESSPVSNLFLNLKYMIERDGIVKDHRYFTDVYASGYVHLLENNAYLPLGFLVDNQILNVDFLSHRNPFDIQNDLMKAATGIQENVWKYTGYNSLAITGDNVEITSQLPYGYCTYASSPERSGTVVFNYTADRDGLMCINLVLSNRNRFTVRLNGKDLYTESYSISQSLAVSNVTAGDVVEVVMYCPANESGFHEVTAAILDDTLFRECYQILASSTLELTHFSNTQIAGTIQCNRDGILYTSIPQDGNWTAYVDGEKASIVLIGDAMCGLPLTKGDHRIEFRYENLAFSLGWKISLGCFLVFIVITICSVLPKKGKFAKERRDSK